MAKKEKKKTVKKFEKQEENKTEIIEEKKEIETKIENKELKTKQNKQIMWAIILMSSIILIIILVPYIKTNYLNKFTYINLDFQKTKLGEIIFYSARIPITNQQGQIAGDFPINLRNDPRKLEYINGSIPNNTFTFNKNLPVYITLNPDMRICEDNTIAVVGLTGFLKDFGNLNIKAAMTDKDYANASRFPYVTCENSPNNTVIKIDGGNETMVTKTSDNCYEITFKECEILQVTEKFQLIILKNYMGYFKVITQDSEVNSECLRKDY
jgi:hypothetical protein